MTRAWPMAASLLPDHSDSFRGKQGTHVKPVRGWSFVKSTEQKRLTFLRTRGEGM